MTTLEDRLDSFPQAWRPDAGEMLIGEIVDIDSRSSDYDGSSYPLVTVRTEDGEEFTFHGFHAVARRELAKKRPQIGERIGIRYFGRGEAAKPGMNAPELYKIVVERDETAAVDWDAVAGDDEPALEPSESGAEVDSDIPF